jgi:hypothetical protein
MSSSSEKGEKKCQDGACEPFKRLGTVSDYTGLLDAVVKFKAWKESVFKPIVADLAVSLHTLKETNHLLHELSELVTSSVSTQEFDDVVCSIESQLQMLGLHMSTLRNAPSTLLKFKQKTAEKLQAIKNKYASAMKEMQQVARPCLAPRRRIVQPIRRHIIAKYPQRHYITPAYPRRSSRRIAKHVKKKYRRRHKSRKHRKHHHKKHHHKKHCKKRRKKKS